MGKSVQGNFTKIHLAVNSSGNPIDFTLTGAEAHDFKVAPDLVKDLPQNEYTVADKGYNNDPLRIQIRD